MTGFDAVRLVFAAWLVITVTMIVTASRWNRLLTEVRLERDVWRVKYHLGVAVTGTTGSEWVPFDMDER